MNFTPLEIFASIFTLVCVWFTVKRNILCWPFGIIGVSLYFIVFYQNKLYADMGLQVVYFAQSVYGWYFWLHGKKEDEGSVPIRNLSQKGWLLLIPITLSTILLIGYLSTVFTDTDVAYFDATVATVSLVANMLLARKIIDNWYLWIAVDVVYVGLFLFKGLYITAALYVIFFFMAITGLLEWRKEKATQALHTWQI